VRSPQPVKSINRRHADREYKTSRLASTRRFRRDHKTGSRNDVWARKGDWKRPIAKEMRRPAPGTGVRGASCASSPASPALTAALPSPLRRGDGHERSNESRAERRGRLVVERQCTAPVKAYAASTIGLSCGAKSPDVAAVKVAALIWSVSELEWHDLANVSKAVSFPSLATVGGPFPHPADTSRVRVAIPPLAPSHWQPDIVRAVKSTPVARRGRKARSVSAISR
jgi:hypothetical protein